MVALVAVFAAVFGVAVALTVVALTVEVVAVEIETEVTGVAVIAAACWDETFIVKEVAAVFIN